MASSVSATLPRAMRQHQSSPSMSPASRSASPSHSRSRTPSHSHSRTPSNSPSASRSHTPSSALSQSDSVSDSRSNYSYSDNTSPSPTPRRKGSAANQIRRQSQVKRQSKQRKQKKRSAGGSAAAASSLLSPVALTLADSSTFSSSLGPAVAKAELEELDEIEDSSLTDTQLLLRDASFWASKPSPQFLSTLHSALLQQQQGTLQPSYTNGQQGNTIIANGVDGEDEDGEESEESSMEVALHAGQTVSEWLQLSRRALRSFAKSLSNSQQRAQLSSPTEKDGQLSEDESVVDSLLTALNWPSMMNSSFSTHASLFTSAFLSSSYAASILYSFSPFELKALNSFLHRFLVRSFRQLQDKQLQNNIEKKKRNFKKKNASMRRKNQQKVDVKKKEANGDKKEKTKENAFEVFFETDIYSARLFVLRCALHSFYQRFSSTATGSAANGAAASSTPLATRPTPLIYFAEGSALVRDIPRLSFDLFLPEHAFRLLPLRSFPASTSFHHCLLDCSALEEDIGNAREDNMTPVLLFVTAGDDVATEGRFQQDDLKELGRIAKLHGLWLHAEGSAVTGLFASQGQMKADSYALPMTALVPSTLSASLVWIRSQLFSANSSLRPPYSQPSPSLLPQLLTLFFYFLSRPPLVIRQLLDYHLNLVAYLRHRLYECSFHIRGIGRHHKRLLAALSLSSSSGNAAATATAASTELFYSVFLAPSAHYFPHLLYFRVYPPPTLSLDAVHLNVASFNQYLYERLLWKGEEDRRRKAREQNARQTEEQNKENGEEDTEDTEAESNGRQEEQGNSMESNIGELLTTVVSLHSTTRNGRTFTGFMFHPTSSQPFGSVFDSVQFLSQEILDGFLLSLSEEISLLSLALSQRSAFAAALLSTAPLPISSGTSSSASSSLSSCRGNDFLLISPDALQDGPVVGLGAFIYSPSFLHELVHVNRVNRILGERLSEVSDIFQLGETRDGRVVVVISATPLLAVKNGLRKIVNDIQREVDRLAIPKDIEDEISKRLKNEIALAQRRIDSHTTARALERVPFVGGWLSSWIVGNDGKKPPNSTTLTPTILTPARQPSPAPQLAMSNPAANATPNGGEAAAVNNALSAASAPVVIAPSKLPPVFLQISPSASASVLAATASSPVSAAALAVVALPESLPPISPMDEQPAS